ncbi:transcriptional regulator [Haloferula helveola]|uniref:Transcriptional regulator n=1 Tax=Haloferula helveola TaxID=490095 RepID=A0ABN6H7A8_9BACT|nr:transcriptional regulator [Haloferula helveola]
MFARGVRDLVKKQWVRIVDELKLSGGLPVPELQRRLGGSYMGIKDQCEALRKRGYLETWRIPRKGIGRPEIMYRLTEKASCLFPDAGGGLSVALLDAARHLFGDTAPERMLLQHFQKLREDWQPKISKAKSLVEKATLLSALREKEGCFGRCKYDPDQGFRIEEYHHPLQPIFDLYPNAIQFELRMMEELLGSKVIRREVPGGRGGPARVDYEVATLGVRAD